MAHQVLANPFMQKLGFNCQMALAGQLDPTEHAGSVSTADRQLVEMEILEQGDAVTVAQVAFLLPEH
jgi:hypothetical protein